MKVKVYTSDLLEANCYLVSVNSFNIVIDPCVQYNKLLTDLSKNEHNKKINAILITHGHFDHFDKLQTYLDSSDALVYCHTKAIEKINSGAKNCSSLMKIPNVTNYSLERFNAIKEGKLTLNNDNNELIIDCLYTPGHTNCCLSYVIESSIFTGDFLFKNSVGRTDLYSSNNTVMKITIEEFKMKVRDKHMLNYTVYPGHGLSTIVEDELRNNPYIF